MALDYKLQEEMPNNRFKLIKNLGLGLFSQTKLALDNKTDEIVIVKILSLHEKTQEELDKSKAAILALIKEIGLLEKNYNPKYITHNFLKTNNQFSEQFMLY